MEQEEGLKGWENAYNPLLQAKPKRKMTKFEKYGED
jgi:hypothetical protein